MIDRLKALVPAPLKQLIKDQVETVEKYRRFGSLAPLVPFARDMFDGPRDLAMFKTNGEDYLRIYQRTCGLRPDETMLDVGSGIGRKTLPLTQYFSAAARYEGIDIAAAGVEWCAKRYTPRFPNFRFQQIDVYNKFYNPTGRLSAAGYRFPFDDNTFTFVMLGSVFTHMMPDGLVRYLNEVERVMAPGGRCLITYFLLNDVSRPLIEAGKATQHLRFGDGPCRYASEELPELSVGFDEGWVLDQYRAAGLAVTGVQYGSWCDRAEPFSYQDHVLATKPAR